MDSSKVTISCVKNDCPGQLALHESHCPLCQTYGLKRYLRVIEAPFLHLQPGHYVGGGDRYWVTQNPNIVLDTQPQKLPFLTNELPPSIESYLRLSTHLAHIPKVFGLMTSQQGWLLEYPTIELEENGLPFFPDLFPTLVESWLESTPLQKLNWLQQIASLIPDFIQQGAVGTFYNLDNWAISGGLIQVQQLQLDHSGTNLDFAELGDQWEPLLSEVDPIIKPFILQLQQDLSQNNLSDPKQLQHILQKALCELGSKHYQYTWELYTQTDSGPTREHNEDACFPTPGTPYRDEPLAIVCDGIGGHEGGEVASAIAIDTFQQSLPQSIGKDPITSQQCEDLLRDAIYKANDAISDRNDREQRLDRNRMGTTLVMAQMAAPLLYLGYVGDSRIYRITNNSCHQLSYDDDFGSREVRLGYQLYLDSQNHAMAGALIQALGMNPSSFLFPHVFPVAPDQDSIYLLCSDGLSDFDRVETHWPDEIAPLLRGELTIAQVGERLITIANTQNGHDNSTIALLHVKVQAKSGFDRQVIPAQAIARETAILPSQENPITSSLPQTEILEPSPLLAKPAIPIQWLIALVLLSIIGITAIIWPRLGHNRIEPPTPAPSPQEAQHTTREAQPSSEAFEADLEEADVSAGGSSRDDREEN